MFFLQPNVPYQACLLPDGKQGHCRHLNYCMMDAFKNDFTKFMDYLCVIKRSAIGACCPDSFADERNGGLAGDLPATAPREEENEAITRITRAENRGP
ncbi:hypothetical protein EVAR_18267_1 [Eumeta japonica]|uniref:Clip domain-containing protein n=1 Tax=Eumeta variegata TaxID=151549 RepID=A0A4C1UKE9_EUMVA|nr:hypothetical protein EVAR_18267_1 [Eumeta japonica]